LSEVILLYGILSDLVLLLLGGVTPDRLGLGRKKRRPNTYLVSVKQPSLQELQTTFKVQLHKVLLVDLQQRERESENGLNSFREHDVVYPEDEGQREARRMLA
jgi:hypothetical protein